MNLPIRLAAVAAAACTAAACSTPVPQALKPQDVPAKFIGPVAPGASLWPTPDWWRAFGSDELTGLVTTAQTDNLDIAVAMASVLQAQANRDVVRAALFPDFTATAGASRSRTPSSTFVTGQAQRQTSGSFSSNSFNLGLNGTFTPDIWGLAQDNLRAAEESLKSSRFAQEEVALTTTATVATTYFDVLALREQIATTEQNIAAARRILAVTQAKVTNGVSSQLDLAQQEATVEGQEAALPPLRESEREARFALAVLLGRPPEGFDVTAQNLNAIRSPLVAPGLPSALIERRPDIAEAEANLASAHANVDAARAAFFPAISLTGGTGFASTALSTLFPGGFEWSIGSSALQQIFDGGKLIAQSDLAKAQQQGLVATYRKTVINAFSNAETGLGQVANFGDQQAALEREVSASANAFRISELQYREGITDILSVLQAQETLFTAENQLIVAKLSRVQANVGLYEALGGGWTQSPDEATQTTTTSGQPLTAQPAPPVGPPTTVPLSPPLPVMSGQAPTTPPKLPGKGQKG